MGGKTPTRHTACYRCRHRPRPRCRGSQPSVGSQSYASAPRSSGRTSAPQPPCQHHSPVLLTLSPAILLRTPRWSPTGHFCRPADALPPRRNASAAVTVLCGPMPTCTGCWGRICCAGRGAVASGGGGNTCRRPKPSGWSRTKDGFNATPVVAFSGWPEIFLNWFCPKPPWGTAAMWNCACSPGLRTRTITPAPQKPASSNACRPLPSGWNRTR